MVLGRKTTFVWSLSVVVLVVASIASGSSGFSTKDSGIGLSRELLSPTETDISSEKPLQQNTDKCVSNKGCVNGGVCSKDEDGNNYCLCKNGTSGDNCGIVDDCVRYPMLCGLFKDVQCVYDLENQKAKCKCNNDSEGFDSYLEKCRVPCTASKECPDTVLCRKQPGDDFGFCRCYLDHGGDRCTDYDVNQCQERGLDCGNNPNVTCEAGNNGPVCYCHSWSEGYNYQAKDCLKCNCEGSNLGCRWFPNGTKECYCQKNYYQENGKCKACKCGFGSDGCKLVNGTKKCDCWKPYLDNDGVCEECNCGKNQVDCTFKNKKKSCSCKSGYLQSNRTCRRNCDLWGVKCNHGGKCVDSACQCLPGTSGDVCDVIEGCEDKWAEREKCGGFYFYDDSDVSCDFNATSLQAYCRCKTNGYLFDEPNKRCKACDCGPFGSCRFVKGSKTCDCKEGYSVRPSWTQPSKCERCECGERSTACSFDNNGNKLCVCQKGYSQKRGTCEECNCGDHGTCAFTLWDQKHCNCYYGYVEKNGSCLPCKCGLYHTCELNEKNEKRCICKEGYGYNGDQCQYCDCYLEFSTGINCTFKDTERTCLCPEGYTADDSNCRDINECLNRSACPQNTTCRNTAGSYTCSCITGYRPYSNKQDPKTYGCTEINECVEKTACPYRDTSECVNTLGSYYCRCKKGYSSSFSTYTIEMSGCEEDQLGWKIGYIILIVVFIIPSIVLTRAIRNKNSS